MFNIIRFQLYTGRRQTGYELNRLPVYSKRAPISTVGWQTVQFFNKIGSLGGFEQNISDRLPHSTAQ